MLSILLKGVTTMDYNDFVELVQRQDTRNTFKTCDINLSFMPQQLQMFYALYNPIDVEIVLADLTSIRLCPVSGLKKIQYEYPIDKKAFVFATREGDAIYHMPDGIFTCAHGSNVIKHEKIADSFDSFIEKIVKEIS